MILSFKDKKPRIGPNVFIAPTAVIIGDVTIEQGAGIWYGTVVRGDTAPIHIGANTNVQDNCTIHVDHGKPAVIGADVTVGHNAIVHGCTIEPQCLIGMNAVVLSGATVKTGCVVAAGAVIKENQAIGPFELVAGAPAVKKKDLDPSILELLDLPVQEYLTLAKEHRRSIAAHPDIMQQTHK